MRGVQCEKEFTELIEFLFAGAGAWIVTTDFSQNPHPESNANESL